MQHEGVHSTNGDCLSSSFASGPFFSPDRRPLSPLYLNNDGDLPYPYSIFSSKEDYSPFPAFGSASISSCLVSVDEVEADALATDDRLYLALQYQDIAERYDVCLAHLRDAAEEAESLRRENSNLRAANGELAKRLDLLSGKHPGHLAPSAAMALANDLRLLSVPEPTPHEKSPTSVLAFQQSGGRHRFGTRPVPEKRVSLPKNISVRSSGYLKLDTAGGAGSALNLNGRVRVSNPIPLNIGSQRVQVGGMSNSKNGERGGEEEEEEEGGCGGGGGGGGGLELQVYHQGMFKTEVCNKWEESGVCPYGDHCQFAHGIAELRPVVRHPRYKTELCRLVLFGDACPYGHRCHFRHSLFPSDHQPLLRR